MKHAKRKANATTIDPKKEEVVPKYATYPVTNFLSKDANIPLVTSEEDAEQAKKFVDENHL